MPACNWSSPTPQSCRPENFFAGPQPAVNPSSYVSQIWPNNFPVIGENRSRLICASWINHGILIHVPRPLQVNDFAGRPSISTSQPLPAYWPARRPAHTCLTFRANGQQKLSMTALPNIEKKTLIDEPRSVSKTCSRKEAATYLGISSRTFDRIQKTKAIAYVMVGLRRRYLQSDLDNYLKANRSI